MKLLDSLASTKFDLVFQFANAGLRADAERATNKLVALQQEARAQLEGLAVGAERIAKERFDSIKQRLTALPAQVSSLLR